MKAGALFAGIGGFCLGFGRAGIQTSWAVELNPSAAATYRENLPQVRLLERDICDVSVDKDDLEPVDVLHAGFPCQSFSQAGRRQGFEDPRGRLFFEIFRLISGFKDKKPKAIIFENAPFLKYGEGGAWFLEVKNAIQRAGYWFRDANAAELNAFTLTSLPQQRSRLFMVALSTDHFRSGRFNFPAEAESQAKRLEDYIDFVGPSPDEYYLPEGNRYHKMILNNVDDRSCVYQLRKYLVRTKEPGVCPTLTANMGAGGHNVPFIVDTKGLRKLTEYECLKLQGFPEGFRFPEAVPRAHRYTQAGNAVAVPVAELVAGKVKERFMQEASL